MIRAICDRCGAEANARANEKTTKTIIVSSKDPSTNPVTADVEATVALSVNADLCPVCQQSALLGLLAILVSVTGKPQTKAITAILSRSLAPEAGGA